MLSRWPFLIVLLAAALLLLPASAATAAKRVALVVGNAEYQHAGSLRNPRNDAEDMAALLGKMGFDVLIGVDLDQQKFAAKIDQFARMLDEAEVGLFFYAGHGVQINEKNYLVSANARLTSEFLVASETIELDAIIRLMESKASTNLVFLDACRNNPLAEDLRRNLAALKRNVSLGRGLARIEPTGRDTLIAFAAAPGQEANDGLERNSPFTTALLKHMPAPGLEVSVMLKQVAADVRRDTKNVQRPQQVSDMSRVFYFRPPNTVVAAAVDMPMVAEKPASPSAPSPPPVADNSALEVAFWNGAQAANQCEAVRAYLQRFPNGNFVELARLSEQRLCTQGRRVDVTTTLPSGPVQAASEPALAPPPGATISTAPVAVAALPDPVVQPRTAADLAADLARNAQLELLRLGCGSAEANGIWGPSSRDAVRLFNKHARAKADDKTASPTLVAALRAHEKPVCPLECGKGMRAQGSICVAAKPVPKAATRGAADPAAARAAPARQAPPAARAKQEKPASDASSLAVPAGLMLMYGIGTSIRR